MRGPYLFARDHRLLNPVSRQFLRDPRTKLAKETVRRYSNTWEQVQRRHPDLRVEEFTNEILVDFLTVDDAGKKREVGEPGWREKTLLGHISALKKIFKYAHAQRIIGVDPAVDLLEYGPANRGRTYRRHNWLTKPLVGSLLDAANEDALGLRNRTVMQMLLGTGVREFELEAFTWGDLDLDATPVIAHVNHGKGDKYRAVPLTAKTITTMQVWWEASGRGLGRPVAATDPLFPRARGQWFTAPTKGERNTNARVLEWGGRSLGTQGIRDLVEHHGTLIGVPTLRPHDLRRTYAGLLEEAGVKVQDISKLLGHSSVDTTMKYLADSPAKRAAAVAGADW